MTFQPRIDTQSPYINIEAMKVTRDAQSRFRLVLKRFPTPSSDIVKALWGIMYILFFAWQVIGLILYSIRAFEAGLVAKHTSFQSTQIEMFRHSEQLELFWVMSQILNTCLVIMFLPKVPSFLGYSVILKLLVRLPAFWSLVSLYAMTIVGYFLIIGLKNDSGMEIALILALMIVKVTQVILIGFLNFTQINHSRRKCGVKMFAFFKMNIFLLFLSYFIDFVIGSLQFALHVYGIDDYDVGISSEFLSLIGTIRRFTTVIFCYRVYIFHWEKVFVDNRNILCHHDYLDQSFDNSPQGDIPFAPASPA